jgi:hypothetical protein
MCANRPISPFSPSPAASDAVAFRGVGWVAAGDSPSLPVTAARADWTPPRAHTIAGRVWDTLRDAADAAGLFLVILALAPFLWLCCREEARDARLKAQDGGAR